MITYLTVPYEEKDTVKRLGALWSPSYKKWYIKDVENISAFSKWISNHLNEPHKATPYELQFKQKAALSKKRAGKNK
jgi:hypothetical protein